MALGDSPQNGAPDPLGRRAYELEFGRLAAGIIFSDDDPAVEKTSRAISKARQAAEAGDYVGAIRLLGDVKVSVQPAGGGPGMEGGVKPEDVEQALGDLRRALAREKEFPGRPEVQRLCQAAREAASEGRWDGAWALIDEADQRLGDALASKGSREGTTSPSA